MAPVLTREALGSSIWPYLDASQPTISRRYYYYSSLNPAVVAIPVALVVALVLLGCCARVRLLKSAAAKRQKVPVSQPRDQEMPGRARRFQATSVPPPVSDQVLDPPPPYMPLQTLTPAHKPVDNTLERPADTERNVGNHGQSRSMLDV